MSERITDRTLAEYQDRADEFELDTRTWSDRDELLQALKAERERIKELEAFCERFVNFYPDFRDEYEALGDE